MTLAPERPSDRAQSTVGLTPFGCSGLEKMPAEPVPQAPLADNFIWRPRGAALPSRPFAGTARSSSGLGHSPLKAGTRVRLPYALPAFMRVSGQPAQMHDKLQNAPPQIATEKVSAVVRPVRLLQPTLSRTSPAVHPNQQTDRLDLPAADSLGESVGIEISFNAMGLPVGLTSLAELISRTGFLQPVTSRVL